MQKILFIITQSEWGGAQQFLFQLINNLDKNEYNILLAYGEGNDELPRRLEGIVETRKLKHLKRSSHIIEDIKSLFEIRSLIKECRPDVIFLNSSKAGFNSSLAANFPTRFSPPPLIIYRIGGWTFNDPWPWYKKIFFYVLEFISARWKDIIIVNNKHDLEQAKKLHILPEKELVYIPNGIDATALNFMPKDEARNFFEKCSKKIKATNEMWIGTIANFYKTKGIDDLIKSAKLLPDNYNFFIIGDGPERKKITSILHNNNLQNRVYLVGKVPDAYKYLKAFDIYVQPSRKEGWPWAILEAMAAELPIIATAVGAIPEILNEKTGIIISPKDPEAIAESIKLLSIASHSERYAMALAAKQRVTEHFTLEKMIGEYKKLFKSQRPLI